MYCLVNKCGEGQRTDVFELLREQVSLEKYQTGQIAWMEMALYVRTS